LTKLLVLTGVVMVALMGIGMPSRDSARISPSSEFIPASVSPENIESPVVPAILLSEENTTDLWGSGLIVKVATTRRHHRRRVVVRRRKFSHSAAIVGGSAAAGAGIGALAGGGKGAIIGGLAGGGAGLLYDRKTAKKKRVVTQ